MARGSRIQERRDVVDHRLGLVEREEVAAAFDDSRRAAGIRRAMKRRWQRDHWVVVARQDQRRLRYPVKPWNARPCGGVELEGVAEQVGRMSEAAAACGRVGPDRARFAARDSWHGEPEEHRVVRRRAAAW